MKQTYIILVMTLMSMQVFCQGSWVYKAPLPAARAELALTAFASNIFVLGGTDTSGAGTPWLDVYYPFNNSFTSMNPMPTPREELVACEYGGEIYAIGGGFDPNSIVAVETYNFLTGNWGIRPAMPTGRREACLAVVNNKIYIFGGLGSPNAGKAVECFDPSTNIWVSKTPLASERKYCAVGVVNGKVYLIGGDVASGHTAECSEYNPATDTWTAKSPAPYVFTRAASCVYQNKIYIIGGYTGQASGDVMAYDPATDTYTILPSLNVPRESLAAAQVNGKIFAMGGFDDQRVPLDVNEMLDLTTLTDEADPKPELKAWVQDNMLRLYSGMQGDAVITLSDLAGREIMRENTLLLRTGNSFDIPSLLKGIYLLSVRGDEGVVSVKLVVP
ncbi:MAG TPA: T9SS type A sorting domain-containing protein [Bacteroidales bacterium]|nr:T9SS type A sorting domain-containing protein [Bacteroidales bacterium]HSA42766.1 T9SS type A sorting domain-containing protein [Bacteroidales bacterium]